MKKLRLAVYGIDHNHCAAKVSELKSMPDLFEICGVYCESKEAFNRRGKEKCYEDLKFMSEDELFSLKDLDFILVEPAVPNLVKFAKVCIDKGYHIHLDKPAGVNLKEFEELLNEAKKKNLIIQMGYMYRYNKAIRYVLDNVKQDKLGNIISVDCQMSTGLDSNFKKNFLMSYGVKSPAMYIYGVHLIDLIVTVMGKPTRVIPLNKKTMIGDLDFEDSGFAILEYPNAVCTVRVNASEVNGWERREFVVCGEKGTIQVKPIENPTQIIECYKNEAKSWSSCGHEVGLTPQDYRYKDQFVHLSRMIQKLESNPYSYEHEYLVHKLTLEACGYKFDE